MSSLDFNSLRDRYIAFFGEEPASRDTVAGIESSLDVILPDDLKQIATFYRGGLLGGVSHNAIDTSGPATNVVEETLRLRSAINLPQRFVVLSEPPNSLVVLDCKCRATNAPTVIWCAAHDVERFGDLTAMSNPETWPTYAEFFSYLLDEEEEEREEE